MVMIKREGRWASDTFVVFVRSNMEDQVWASKVFVKGGGGGGRIQSRSLTRGQSGIGSRKGSCPSFCRNF